jgi:autotransporter-associated beta strand protein
VNMTANGTLDLGAFNNTILSLNGSGSVTTLGGLLTIQNGSGSGTFDGIISGTGGVTLTGGNLQLTGTSNTYTGQTTINNTAALTAGASGSLPSQSNVTVNGTLDLGAYDSTILSLNGSGSVTTLGGILTIQNGSGSGTFDGIISGTGGATLTGGNLRLAGTSNTYTGQTTINNTATLTARASSSLPSQSNATVDGTLDLGAFDNTILSLNGSGSVTTQEGTLTISNGGSFSGSITGTGAGGLTVSGGTLSLSGTNSYHGKTTINSNATLTANTSLANSSVAVNGTFNMINSFSIANLSGGSTGRVLLNSTTLTFGSDNLNALYQGAIHGTGGGITKEGSGIWTLAGSNSDYTDTTTISSGTILAANRNALSNASIMDIASGAELELDFDNGVKSLAGAGNVVLGQSAFLTILTDSTFNGSIADKTLFSDYGGIILGGASPMTLIFSGQNNSYSGFSVVNQNATLQGDPTVINTLSPNSVILLLDGTLNVLSDNVIANLGGSPGSTVDLHSSTLTIGGDHTDSIFDGTITNACGNLHITNGNTLTLAGTATYCGTTDIEDGTLIIAASGALAPAAITVEASGTLQLQNYVNTAPSLTSSGRVWNQGQLTITNGIVIESGLLNNDAQISCATYTQYPAATLEMAYYGTTTNSNSTITSIGSVSLNGTLIVDFANNAQFVTEKATLITGSSVGGTFSSVIYHNHPNSLIPAIFYFPTAVEIGYDITVGPNSIGSLAELLAVFSDSSNSITERALYQLHKRVKHKKGNTDDYLAWGGEDVAFLEWFKRKQSQKSAKIIQSKEEKPRQHHSWRIYAGPTSSFGDFSSYGTVQEGFGYASAGVQCGADYAFSQAGFGIGGNYTKVYGQTRHHLGEFDYDQVRFCAYGSWIPQTKQVLCTQPLAIHAIVGGGTQWYTLKRTLLGDWQAIGKPDGCEFDAMLGAEYLFTRSQFCCLPSSLTISPLANLQYVHVQIGSYDERAGSIYNMKTTLPHARFLWSTIGARIDYPFTIQTTRFQPEIDVGWQHQFLNQHAQTTFSTIQAPWPTTLTMPIDGISRNNLWIGADLLLTIHDLWQIEATYDLEWSNHFYNNSFYLGFGAEF